MSLAARIDALATRVGQEFKAVRAEMAALAGGGSVGDAKLTLAATQATTSTSPASVADLELTGVAPGTYLVKYWLVYRAAATTTGVEFRLNFITGAVSRIVGTWYSLSTGTAQASGIMDQSTTLTAQLMEGKGQRANNAATGPTQGVDSSNADQFAVFEAVVVVTSTGTLQLMFATEVAGSAVTMQTGTTVELRKVA